MAGSQIATSVTILSSGLKGYQGVSLTNFTTSALSAIAAGSTVEIANAFFIFSTEESVTGFTVITTATSAYLALTPSGTAGSQIVNAAWTSTEPVWSPSKQGYYASAASVTRVVAQIYKSGTASMEYAAIMEPQQGKLVQRVIKIGPWDMSTPGTMYIYHGLTIERIVRVTVVIFSDSGGAQWEHGVGLGIYNTAGENFIRIIPAIGGIYDNTNYDSTAVDRGYVVLDYLI